MVELLICMYGVCFNPQHITHLDDRNYISGQSCKVRFYNAGSLAIEDKECSDLAAEINELVRGNQDGK